MGDIVELIEFSGFLFWIACALCMVALLILRKTLPDAQRPWKVSHHVTIMMNVVLLPLLFPGAHNNPNICDTFSGIFMYNVSNY